MSYIPDCRTDKNYNEEELNALNKEYLAGFDWAVKEIVNLLSNTDVFPELDQLLEDNVAVITEGKKQIVEDAITNWAEMSRNELITSMIEGQEG